MTLRTVLLVLLALTVSIGAAWFARNWIEAERAAIAGSIPPPPKPRETPKVLVAKADLPTGTFVKAEHLRWQSWPDDALADNYLVKGKRGLKSMVGAVARHRIAAGQPVTDTLLVKPGDRGFLAAVLTPGTRAISVAVNATTGIAGFVFPGDRVDMLLTQNFKSGDTKRRTSETVIRDLRVLAVDQRTDDQNGKVTVAKTTTLEVTEKQAEMIAVAAALGRLSLSLHSLANDNGKIETPAIRPHVNGSGRKTVRPAALGTAGMLAAISGGLTGKAQNDAKKPTITWDREVSRAVVAGPPKQHHVTVVRGAKATTKSF
jgi:pilus assembly protein CpaB